MHNNKNKIYAELMSVTLNKMDIALCIKSDCEVTLD